MIKLYWEPTNPEAITFPDGLVEGFVESVLQDHKDEVTIEYRIGNELIVNYFRVAVKEGNLLNTELELYTNNGDVLIIFNKEARMDSTIGYPDYFEDTLNRLIRW